MERLPERTFRGTSTLSTATSNLDKNTKLINRSRGHQQCRRQHSILFAQIARRDRSNTWGTWTLGAARAFRQDLQEGTHEPRVRQVQRRQEHRTRATVLRGRLQPRHNAGFLVLAGVRHTDDGATSWTHGPRGLQVQPTARPSRRPGSLPPFFRSFPSFSTVNDHLCWRFRPALIAQ